MTMAAITVASSWPISAEAMEETGLQLRVAPWRQQQLFLHTAEIMLSAAVLDAWVGEGGIGTRNSKQQDRRDGSAKCTFQLRQQTGHAPPPRIPLRDRAKRRVLMTRP
jgi:hypothetical protein